MKKEILVKSMTFEHGLKYAKVSSTIRKYDKKIA